MFGDKATRSIGRATRPTLELVATTETSSAFSAGRRYLAERLVASVTLARTWDATLDQRTCRQCAALDGATVPLRDRFPGGARPGEVHPGCRCIEGVLPAFLLEL